MAKPKLSQPLRQAGDDSLDRFWAQTGLGDAAVTARFFQLFAGRGEGGGASESAQATTSASERIVTLRAPELAAIAIPAIEALGARASLPSIETAANQGNQDDRASQGDGETPQPIVTFALPASAQSSVRTEAAGTGALYAGVPQYAAVFPDDGSAGYVFDTATKQLMPGGPGDYPELFGDTGLRVGISGDLSAGASLSGDVWKIDTVELLAGGSYNLTVDDSFVRAGQTVNISAATLGADENLLFDGSAETDGRFFFIGSDNNDVILGGAGDDRFYGRGGADIMSGGGGRDTYLYFGSASSTGRDYDTIGDFDAALDRISLGKKGAVTSFVDPVGTGTLSLDSFDDDLGALLGGLGAGQAAWVAPDAGDLAGTIFLVVDGNGEAGYQAGEDYVFAIGGSPLEDLTGKTDFFI